MIHCNSSKEYYDLSLKESLEYFINVVKEKGKFSVYDFDKSIESNKILIDNI